MYLLNQRYAAALPSESLNAASLQVFADPYIPEQFSEALAAGRAAAESALREASDTNRIRLTSIEDDVRFAQAPSRKTARYWLALMDHEGVYVESSKPLFPTKMLHRMRMDFDQVFYQKSQSYDKVTFHKYFGEFRQQERREASINGLRDVDHQKRHL